MLFLLLRVIYATYGTNTLHVLKAKILVEGCAVDSA